MKFGTKVIHAGIEPDSGTGAIMTPIYQTSTYVQEAPGQHKGYEYSRTQNPTRSVLQANVAALEGGDYAIAYSSGLAALDALVKLLRPGDEIIANDDLYGGTVRLFQQIYAQFGIRSRFVDLTNPAALEDHLTDATRWVYVETPSNPLLRLVDIEAISAIAHRRGIRVCVDNTFCSPYLQTPLSAGADLVLHSATKYLGGHSDVVLGLLVTRDPQLAERLYFIQNATGAVPGPQDCFLVLRGIKTLHVRMERACANAMAIAQFLHSHPAVAKVYYPGLTSHPQHDLAKRQMRDFGAMLSFELNSDRLDDAVQLCQKTRYFQLAESLGGVESLISIPAAMTHASIPPEQRRQAGLRDTLIRLSVGIEDVTDLIEDLQQALEGL